MPYHRKTKEQFVKEAVQVHGDKYDYSEVEYVNTHRLVRIRCKQCGHYFFQQPSSHLAGHGCPKCCKKSDYRTLSKEEFITRAREVHGDKYDYSKTDYVNMRSKVLIVCPLHGEFWQRAQSHLLGNGCPECKRANHIERIKKMMELLNARENGSNDLLSDDSAKYT